jgi:hypothetical protein
VIISFGSRSAKRCLQMTSMSQHPAESMIMLKRQTQFELGMWLQQSLSSSNENPQTESVISTIWSQRFSSGMKSLKALAPRSP